MSAGDFQTKYASVMESLLKSAIGETTKLFETTVNDLKEEISRMKKENEVLKIRCSQFENGEGHPTVSARESVPLARPIYCSDKRDTAVQCDLVPFCTMLMERCQPLGNSSLQNQQQQCSYEQMEYSFQEHNLETQGDGTSPMAFLSVKQKESSDHPSLQPVLNQEEVEPTVEEVSSAGSPWTSPCGTENEGPLMNQACSAEDMSDKDKETQVTLKLPCVEMDIDVQEAQSQSSEPEHSQALEEPENDMRMTKIQFLAQLEVMPIVQDSQKVSNDFADTRASSTSEEKKLPKKCALARLRSYLETYLQTTAGPNPEPCTETETITVSSEKCRVENDGPNAKNTTSEPIPLRPTRSTRSTKTTNDPIPNSRRRTGQCTDAFKLKRSVGKLRRRSKAISEPTPRTSSPGRGCYIKPSSISPQKLNLTKDDARRKNKKSTSVSPKRCSSNREGAGLKKTESSAAASKSSTSIKMSTRDSVSVNRRRSNQTQDSSSVRQTKRKSSSFSPRRSIRAIAKTKRETGSPNVRWSKLDDVSPRKTRESSPPKKRRLIQGGTSPDQISRVLNAKKVPKAAKTKTKLKMKSSNQFKLQNGAKTRKLAENKASCEALKNDSAKAVWIPPGMLTQPAKTPAKEVKRSSLSPVKNKPNSQNHPVVCLPSLTPPPLPVKAPPGVLPSQPSSGIGGQVRNNQCRESCSDLSSSASLESHVSLKTGCQPFSCKLCGNSFTDSKGLKQHGRVCCKAEIHICHQCGKGFAYRYSLTKHLNIVHYKIKPFGCPICNKAFFTKHAREDHLRIHTGEKPFQCSLCEKKFKSKVELKVHLKWHKGEKKYLCPYCDKGFVDASSLKRHKYIHTGEKPYSCPHCPKKFIQSSHLKKHVKSSHESQ